MNFDLLSCRFHFSARDAIHFAPLETGNTLRGALGNALHKVVSAADYARIFEPASAGVGPSGLLNWPRPFVLRTGGQSSVALNLFDTRNSTLECFKQAFAQLAELASVEQAPVSVELTPRIVPVSRIRVEFQTPTELKTGGRVGNAEFSVLLARARDRVSTLRCLYGAGPLEIDFRRLAERAQSVKMVRSDLRRIAVERRSSRTGQRHGIGGFVGFAEYEGDLAEFLPYLEAAHWTGVGRHCTWGNGQIHTEILDS